MRDYFSTNEWQIIERNGRTDRQNLHRFFEQWTLKESYVKAIGEGLNFSLTRIQFFKFEEIKSNIFRAPSPLFHYVNSNYDLPLYNNNNNNDNNESDNNDDENDYHKEEERKIDLKILVQIDDFVQVIIYNNSF